MGIELRMRELKRTRGGLAAMLSAILGNLSHFTRATVGCRVGDAVVRMSSVLVTGANRGLGLELIRQLGRAEPPPRYLFAGCRDPESPRAKDLKNMPKSFSNLKILKLGHCEGAENVIIGKAEQKALLPALQRAVQLSDEFGISCKKAGVINMVGILGSIELFDDVAGKAYPYRASKAALNMVTKCLTNKLKPHGIICASAHPGWVKTEMGGEQALLTAEESVQGILWVLSKLSEKDSGSLLDWRGQRLPW